MSLHHMLEPRHGHWHLYQAVDKIGRAMIGATWTAVESQDKLKSAMRAPTADLESVIAVIADACESGKLAAAYPNALDGSVDVLDPREWRKPRLHVETYFANGEAILYLPYDPPLSSGELARCERAILIRKDSLESLIASIEPMAKLKPPAKSGAPERYDWEAIRQFTFSELTDRGDFAEKDQVKGWKSAADLYRQIENRFPEGECPSPTSLKERVPQFVDEWRATQGR